MWIILSLSAAIIGAIYYLVLQNMNLNKNIFMLYRGWLVAIFLLPITILNPVIFHTNFYIMATIQGIAVAYMDYLAFEINKKYGSETVSSILPFSVIIIFCFWCIIDVKILTAYMQKSLKTSLILLSVIGTLFSLYKYKNATYTKKAFIELLPILFLSSFIAILNKSIMNYSAENTFICSCQNAMIVGFIVGIIHLFLYKKQQKKLIEIIKPENLVKGCITLLLATVIVLKNIALYYALNPAYVFCLSYTTILWIMLFSRKIPALKFHSQNLQGEKKWKIIFIGSIILFIMATK